MNELLVPKEKRSTAYAIPEIPEVGVTGFASSKGVPDWTAMQSILDDEDGRYKEWKKANPEAVKAMEESLKKKKLSGALEQVWPMIQAGLGLSQINRSQEISPQAPRFPNAPGPNPAIPRLQGELERRAFGGLTPEEQAVIMREVGAARGAARGIAEAGSGGQASRVAAVANQTEGAIADAILKERARADQRAPGLIAQINPLLAMQRQEGMDQYNAQMARVTGFDIPERNRLLAQQAAMRGSGEQNLYRAMAEGLKSVRQRTAQMPGFQSGRATYSPIGEMGLEGTTNMQQPGAGGFPSVGNPYGGAVAQGMGLGYSNSTAQQMGLRPEDLGFEDTSSIYVGGEAGKKARKIIDQNFFRLFSY
jgi:hypothetical protein